MARLSGADIRKADQDAIAIDMGALLIEADKNDDRPVWGRLGLPNELALGQIFGLGLGGNLLSRQSGSIEQCDGSAEENSESDRNPQGLEF